jgi:hypothetical protein
VDELVGGPEHGLTAKLRPQTGGELLTGTILGVLADLADALEAEAEGLDAHVQVVGRGWTGSMATGRLS